MLSKFNHLRHTKASQPRVKGCLEVPGFEPQPSDSHPDTMTTKILCYENCESENENSTYSFSKKSIFS